MFDINEANEYFELHLKRAFWDDLENQTRQAALTAAINDVKNLLCVDELDETDIYIYCAVFEQAVYLAEYYDVLNRPDLVASESVEGVGSRSYTAASKHLRIAPAAAGFLERIAPSGRISRG
ncbi:MAG: hypothetical protein AB7F40_05755 [Victivallaceae bacterium]|nr:hypothetical protein [Victivallaceae bacterium]